MNQHSGNLRGLPNKCFISHSYRDAAACNVLLETLPGDVEPYIFPPISVAPDQMVSNELVSAILGCPGLIYLEGGASAESFWVAFERDYALRSGKTVYAFNPGTRALRRDTSAPLSLFVFPSFATADRDIVGRVLDFMRDHRAFDLGFYGQPAMAPQSRPIVDELADQIIGAIQRGGYVIAFWSTRAASSRWIKAELDRAFDYQIHLMAEQPRRDTVERRILFATLDDTPVPTDGSIGAYDHLLQSYLRERHVEDALAPVRLVDSGGVLNMNRADDLIVRTYWLIFRNTTQSGLQ